MIIPDLSDIEYNALKAFSERWKQDRVFLGENNTRKVRRIIRAYFIAAYMAGVWDISMKCLDKSLQDISDCLEKQDINYEREH